MAETMKAFGPGGRQAPWAHHSDEVRAALMAHGIRPRAKACHANSQRFLLAAVELRERLEYREGLVRSHKGSPFEHAWLTLDGQILDLTLDARHVVYLASYVIEFGDVQKQLGELGAHQLLRRDRIKALWAEVK